MQRIWKIHSLPGNFDHSSCSPDACLFAVGEKFKINKKQPIRFLRSLYVREVSIPKRGTANEFLLTGQLKKVLPENLVDKYQERLQDESLKMVDLPNLVRYVTFTSLLSPSATNEVITIFISHYIPFNNI